MPNKRKTLNISGSNLWYLVGLIATDGCLSSDGRHVDITAKEFTFLEKLRNELKLVNKIGIKNNGLRNQSYRIQIANKNFYEFLLSIGLTSCKSLIMDEVIVPDEFFQDFLRGVIDGDGSIRKWIHSGNRNEQWSLRVYSASLKFVEWLQKEIEQSIKVKGRMHRYVKEKPLADLFVLKYGKIAAQAILGKCYYENALSLDKKIKLAQECCASAAGWKKSKTVLN